MAVNHQEEITQAETLCKNLKACADRLVAANIYKVLPEIGMNIGYTVNGNTVDEVCDIPGRIRRVEQDCCYVREPKMGGSLYMAKSLLALRRKFPQAQVIADLRSSDSILEACRELDFVMVDMPTPCDYWQRGDDFFVDLDKVIEQCDDLPDVITVPDRINLEKLVLVVSADIEDFADKVLALNSMV